MLGLSSLLALIGLLIVLISVVLMMLRKNRNWVIVSFITGLLLIFLPGTILYFLPN